MAHVAAGKVNMAEISNSTLPIIYGNTGNLFSIGYGKGLAVQYLGDVFPLKGQIGYAVSSRPGVVIVYHENIR